MPANTKWPDFQFASKLRHLMGSQSSLPSDLPTNKATTQTGAPEGSQSDDDNSQESALDERIATMAAIDEQQMNAVEGLDNFSNDEDAGNADADFGDLEIFDSNASPAPFGTQTSQLSRSEEQTLDVPSSSSKRDKKKKKDRVKAIVAESAAELASPGKKRKRSKRESIAADGQPADLEGEEQALSSSVQMGYVDAEGDATVTQAHVETTTSPAQAKKKRKHSDSHEGKRQKKKKSHEYAPEDIAHGTQNDAAAQSAFLRTDKNHGNNVSHAIDDDDEMDGGGNSQLSPSVARARRRSRSAGPRSRENSVHFRAVVAPMAPMAIDGLPQDMEALGIKADASVENLAREAWREHVGNRNGNGSEAIERDKEMSDAHDDVDAEADFDDEAVPEQSAQTNASVESPKTARASKGKKQKHAVDVSTAEEHLAETNSSAHYTADVDSPGEAPRKSRGKIATKTSKGRPPKHDKAPTIPRVPPRGEKRKDDRNKENAPSQQPGNGYVRGRFSDDELARVSKAVEDFRVEHGLTQFELNAMIHAPGGTTAGSAHAELWLRLTAQCPDRKRQKVINTTRKRFHNFVARGTWTSEQNDELTQLINVHGTAWAKIAAIINRHPEDVRDRYRNYIVCGAAQRKDVWDREEEQRLVDHVSEAIRDINELRKTRPENAQLAGSSYEELIDWQNISERMGRTRSRLQCITKWKTIKNRARKNRPSKSEQVTSASGKEAAVHLDQAVFAKLETARQQLTTMSEADQYRLVLAIDQAAARSNGKIPWGKLVDQDFSRQWDRESQLLLWYRLKEAVPDADRLSVHEISQYLINAYNQTGTMPEARNHDDVQEREVLTQDMTVSQLRHPGVHEVDPSIQQAEAVEMHVGGQIDDLEMNIDPALSQDPQLMPMQVPTTDKEASKSRTKTKKGSRKSAVENADPIEEVEPTTMLESVDAGPQSSLEEKSRKKKTPSKFKSGGRSKNSESMATPQLSASSSGMDDMEDLPARVLV